jgi:hypothetical protein
MQTFMCIHDKTMETAVAVIFFVAVIRNSDKIVAAINKDYNITLEFFKKKTKLSGSLKGLWLTYRAG